MSKQDIEMVVRKEIVTTEVNTIYSILTCRCCSKKEEFKGKPDMTCLPGGWAALSIKSQYDNVFEWLLCPVCESKVSTVAGLNR